MSFSRETSAEKSKWCEEWSESRKGRPKAALSTERDKRFELSTFSLGIFRPSLRSLVR